MLREGDTVVVWKLDRLGRNTLHILETVKALTDARVTLISTTDGIDSSTAAGRMVIGVLASMAEFERELIKERTALKRAVSRANGTRFGRRKKVADPAHVATARRMKADGHTARDVAKYLGVSRATLYWYLADEAAFRRRGQATPFHPRRGYRSTCSPPAGVSTNLLTPGARGYRPTCSPPAGVSTTRLQ